MSMCDSEMQKEQIKKIKMKSRDENFWNGTNIF